MQKKKGPFTIHKGLRPTKSGKALSDGKRHQPPLYIENILKEIEIPSERTVIDREPIYIGIYDNVSPSTNSTSDTANLEFDQNPYETNESRSVYQGMIYNPYQSLRLISGIANEREFGSEDYELLLQLDEAHKQRNQNTGLDDNTINSFRFWKVTKRIKTENDGDENLYQCSICLHEIKMGQIAKELPCSHIFHKNCIDKWLKSDTRCPLDNQNIKDLL